MGGGFLKKKSIFFTVAEVESHNACELYFSKMDVVFFLKNTTSFTFAKIEIHNASELYYMKIARRCFEKGLFLLFGKSKFTMPVKFNV